MTRSASQSISPDGNAEFLRAVQTAVDEGDAEQALSLCDARLLENNQDADAYRYLGQLRSALGKHAPALQAAKRACELTPDDPRCWSDLGRVCAINAQYADAAQCFEEALAIDSGYTDAWHNLGLARKQMRDRDGAFAALKSALLIDPTRAETYLALGNLLVEAGQLNDAVECFERAAEYDPTLAKARSRLAQELSARGKVKRAETLFRQSLGLNPDHVEGWMGLGRVLEDLGQEQAALDCYRNVLARRIDHATALGQFFNLVRDEAPADLLTHATAALEHPAVPDDAKALVGYGLAKYHDRRREFELAARAGVIANQARIRKNGRLDRAQLTARIDGLISTYDAEFFYARRRFGIGNDQPIFIVGLPRSGTTLTEQILSAHPRLHGAGELPDLAQLALRASDDANAVWRAASKLTEVASREVAHAYMDALHDGAPKHRLRISDKSPLNFFHLAFAALLFPGARVIHCKRDVRDNALSIWMENFNGEQRYATHFDDLAFFIGQYQRLMAHWRAVLPLKILEVQYEDTVTDVETQTRRLVDFVGAPWDARCLDFHRHERAVQTPSRWQVRQPIYSKSVNRWCDYADHLPELKTLAIH